MILRKVMSIMVFSWTQFRLTNFDGKSIQLKFEDLCRQLFINVCVLFTEKYHEECIDVIDFIDNKYYKLEIAEKYVSSYMWRSKESISFEYLLSFISK